MVFSENKPLPALAHHRLRAHHLVLRGLGRHHHMVQRKLATQVPGVVGTCCEEKLVPTVRIRVAGKVERSVEKASALQKACTQKLSNSGHRSPRLTQSATLN